MRQGAGAGAGPCPCGRSALAARAADGASADAHTYSGGRTGAGRATRAPAPAALKPIRVAQGDLDGDGESEVVTVLNVGDLPRFQGALFVIDRRNGRIVVERGPQVEANDTLILFGLHDVAGDPLPEMIWFAPGHGAHTSYAEFFVHRWRPGAFEVLPGRMYISFPGLSVEGHDLLLSGGTVGSAGAGMAQRLRTDRYRWVDAAFRLVDRSYTPSPYAYHRLIDGIVAETYGRQADAAQAFREAAEPEREALHPDMVPPEWRERLAEAVRRYATFRLDKAAGCTAATEWARSHPEFLEALNSPYGYANPKWTAETLCGPMPGSMN